MLSFNSCVSTKPPKIDNIYSQHIEGNKLLYVFTFGCAALILTDPDDIRIVEDGGLLQNYSRVETLFFNKGNLGPIIIREGGRYGEGSSVAVFSIPKNIEKVLVVGFKTRIQRSGDSYNVNYLWTKDPWIIPIFHDYSDPQGYQIVWNGITTLTISEELLPDRINELYLRSVTYGSPYGKKVQPGFIKK